MAQDGGKRRTWPPGPGIHGAAAFADVSIDRLPSPYLCEQPAGLGDELARPFPADAGRSRPGRVVMRARDPAGRTAGVAGIVSPAGPKEAYG